MTTTNAPGDYAARLDIDYPDRPLNRLSTALRFLYILPIAIVLGLVAGGTIDWQIDDTRYQATAAGGVLFLAPMLLIVFRQKYPRWWFDWNLELSRFSTRVAGYFLLMNDQYPSTDEDQNVHLELDYPEVRTELNRWLPLVKWFLAIPHVIVLIGLAIGLVFTTLAAWFAILFTGRFPEPLFRYAEGVLRWGLRVEAYAILLITDRYPPFSLR